MADDSKWCANVRTHLHSTVQSQRVQHCMFPFRAVSFGETLHQSGHSGQFKLTGPLVKYTGGLVLYKNGEVFYSNK